MDLSPKSGNYAIGRKSNFSASILTYLQKSDKTEGATEKCAVKIYVSNFKKYRVITYRFRKILAWYTRLTCFIGLDSPFFRS